MLNPLLSFPAEPEKVGQGFLLIQEMHPPPRRSGQKEQVDDIRNVFRFGPVLFEPVVSAVSFFGHSDRKNIRQ